MCVKERPLVSSLSSSSSVSSLSSTMILHTHLLCVHAIGQEVKGQALLQKNSVNSFTSNMMAPRTLATVPAGRAAREEPAHSKVKNGDECRMVVSRQQVSSQMLLKSQNHMHNVSRCDLCAARLPGGSCVTTSCGHTFHQTCLESYVKQLLQRSITNLRCPACMVPLNVLLPSSEDANGLVYNDGQLQQTTASTATAILPINYRTSSPVDDPLRVSLPDGDDPKRESLPPMAAMIKASSSSAAKKVWIKILLCSHFFSLSLTQVSVTSYVCIFLNYEEDLRGCLTRGVRFGNAGGQSKGYDDDDSRRFSWRHRCSQAAAFRELCR